MEIKYLTNETFDDFIKNADKPVIVDFYADWCGPCKMVAPILEEIASETDDVYICKVNTDEAQAVAMQFQIQNIPTFISFKDGEIINKHKGALGKEAILELVN